MAAPRRTPRRLAPIAAALLLAGFGSGCFRNTYTTGQPQGGGIYVQKAHFWIFGIVGQKTVDMGQVCPDGVAWFQNRLDFIDGFATCLTCGIYSPSTIEVRCASGQGWLMTPDEEAGLTWVEPLDADAGGAL